MDLKSISFFFSKIKNRIHSERNILWKFCNVNRISMLGYKPFTNADSFKSKLRSMLGAHDASLLVDISDEEIRVILNSADQALKHEFDLLGSGPVRVDPIDWHIDFKCGTKWKRGFYREIKTPQGADIKMPWELSRCQHQLWLGEAYLITKDTKYAKEIVDEISWWIDDNPLMCSVNWTCSMDVAFRAVNWMFALNMISEYQGFDEVFSNKVSKSLWQHAFFIRNNLEKQIPYSNNHYASDIVGLLYLEALFNKTNKGRSWFRFALKEYYTEIRRQVLPSGIHYERTVSYHRLMSELFSYPVYMLRRLDVDIPSDVLIRVKGMYTYIANYTKPNGLAPLVGDNDDGRFVPFLRRDFRAHNYLNDPLSVENRLVSVGIGALFCTTSEAKRLYEDAGVAIKRQENNYLFVNLGGYSKYPHEDQTIIGTHTHNDLLSFELALGGEDLIVDAGTFLYTSSPKDRDEFRSTAKHNTIMVDGEEQNEPAASFSVKRNVRIGMLHQKDAHFIQGEYSTIKGGMHHCRSFCFENGNLKIIDNIKKEGLNHSLMMFFHVAEGINPIVDENRVMLGALGDIVLNKQPKLISIINDTLSPSYGVKTASKTVSVNYIFDEEIELITIIKNNGQE